MTREAPAVERVVKLLRFLAEHPGREFGLTELSTAVEINKATCHAMLVTLDRHALVHRDEVTKKYSLDAGLLSLADAVAPNASRALSLSQSVIADMSRELDLPCFATMLLHGHTVIAARVALGSVGFVEGQAAVVGHRQRWRPPIGPIFAAWAAPEVRDAWLAGETQEVEAYFSGVLARIRSRGYFVSRQDDPRTRFLQLLARMGEQEGWDDAHAVLADYVQTTPSDGRAASTDDEPEAIASIVAPVFDRDAQVVLVLSVDGFPEPLGAKDIESVAKRLLQGTDEVTRAIGGTYPAGWPYGGWT